MNLIANIKNLCLFTVALFFFSTSFSWAGSSLDSTVVQSLQSSVSSSSDDAEERANGSVRLKGSDLKMVSDRSRLQIVGIRFADLNISENATVTKAYIQFKADERSSENTELTIYAEDTDHAAVFSSAKYNISKRIKTGVSASWSPVAWKRIGKAGKYQRTSDLTAIVQKIISRPGWKSGNAMAFIITGSGKRVAESYNGDAAGAPQFYVEYTITDDGNSSEPTSVLTQVTRPVSAPVTASIPAPTSTPVPTPTKIPTPAPTTRPTPSDNAVCSGEVKDSSTGNALANVKVSLGGSVTITDAKGLYELSNLAEDEEAVVNFEKEGYLIGSTHIQIKTNSSNYLEYSMHAHNYQREYAGTEEISGGDHIIIDTSTAYIDARGRPYNGSVTVGLTFLDVTTGKRETLFPGTFKGINTNGTMVQFDTYGLISITLKDSKGNSLDLANSETMTLRFDEASSPEKLNTLPLWYYDYEQGLWFEEGNVQLQADGTYKGEILHLGTWSLNRPL